MKAFSVLPSSINNVFVLRAAGGVHGTCSVPSHRSEPPKKENHHFLPSPRHKKAHLSPHLLRSNDAFFCSFHTKHPLKRLSQQSEQRYKFD